MKLKSLDYFDKLSKRLKISLGLLVVFFVVGTVGALNGWFGGGAKIPTDTMTRGLVGYWSFDEASGPLVFDKSNEGNNGMINDGGSGNPVSYWTFDEGSGNVLNDYVNSNNGVIYGSPLWSSNGRNGGALSFDGKNDYVQVPDSSSLTISGGVTVEAWIKPDKYDSPFGQTYIAFKASWPNSGWFFQVRTDTEVLRFMTADGSAHSVDSSVKIPLNEWTHVVGLSDGTINSVYVNGVEVGTSTTGTLTNSTGSLYISSNSSDYDWNGLIDDLKVYNYARTADDIMEDYLETYKNKFVDGKIGNALQFDGIDDWVDIGNPESLQMTNDLTIELWAKLDSSQVSEQFADIISHGHSSTQGWTFQFDHTISPTGTYVHMSNGGTTLYSLDLNRDLFDDAWHHYIVTKSSSNGMHIYIDGKWVTGNNGYVDPMVLTTENGVNIGRDSGTGNARAAKGLIDEVRIYNRALSKEEVRYHYNYGGPVAHWTFDEGNGTTTYDITDNGNDGTFISDETSPKWVVGKYGTGLLFDGENDYIEAPDIDVTEFTISAWVKPKVLPSAAGHRMGIVGDRNAAGSSPNFLLLLETGDTPRIYYVENSSNWHGVDSGESVIADNWYYLVGTYDGVNMNIYVNGILKNSEIETPEPDLQDITVKIGYEGYSDRYFNGIIDDVRIYDYARTPDEIKLDYNAGLGVRFGDPETDMSRGLVGYWNMDEGGGQYVYDQSGYSNTGYVRPDGKSLYFDGSNDFVSIDGPTLGTKSLSVEMWFKMTEQKGDSRYLTSVRQVGGSYDYGFYLNIKSDATPLFASGNVPGDMTSVGGSAIDLDTWYHIIGVRDISGGVTDLSLYIDGDLVGTNTWNGIVGLPSFVAIGKHGGTSYNFPGNISEVRIYDKALTADEAKEHYKGIFGDQENLVGYWPLDEGYGNIAHDKSGNAANGTLVYGPVWENNMPQWTQGVTPLSGGSEGGGALEFDGVDDYVDLGDDSSLEDFSAKSVFLWYKAGSYTGNSRVIYAGTYWNSPYGDAILLRYDGDNAQICLNNTAGNSVCSDYIPHDADTWTLLGYTWDGNTVRYYKNGAEYGTEDYLDGVLACSASGKHIILGSDDADSPTDFYDGLIDEVRVYNRALSTEEVRYHYNKGKPVAHWKFDEGSGTTTYDSSWSNYDGQFLTSETSPAWVKGKYGTGLLFDGVDDYVSLADINTPETITIGAWIRVDSYSNSTDFYGIIGTPSSGNGYMMIRLGNGTEEGRDLFDFAFYNGTSYPELYGTSHLAAGAWYYVVATYDGKYMRTYVNGIEESSQVDVGPTTSGQNLIVGADLLGSDRYFNGIIDDVSIYNYARSAEEIRLDYNEGLAGRFSPEDTGCLKDPAGCMDYGLVGYWNMDEGGGNFTYDQSDYNNTGYIRPDGKALELDGSNDYVDCGRDDSLNLYQQGSAELWFKSDGAQAENYIGLISKGTGQQVTFNISSPGNKTQIRGMMVKDNVDFVQIVKSFDWDADLDWHHIVYTWDGSYLRLYWDGSSGASPVSQTVSMEPHAEVSLLLGAYANKFNGFINEVRIYNRVLSSEEILEHYKGIFRDETGLVGYWPFNEGYGTIAHDESVKGNNGTLVNEPAWEDNGPRQTQGAKPLSGGYLGGGALEFDGVDDYVYVPRDASLEFGTGDFSLEQWVKVIDNSASPQTILSKRGSGSTWYTHYIDASNGNSRLEIAAGKNSYSTGVDLGDNTWHHIIWIRKSGAVRVYIDGIDRTSSSYLELEGNVTDTSGDLVFGRYPTASVEFFDGLIDEVRLYNRALSAEEVRYHYNKGGPVGWWKFDEGSGTTTYDETMNNNDGTLTNGPVWAQGKYGSALYLDGNDDYIRIEHDDIFNFGTGDFSWELWAKPEMVGTRLLYKDPNWALVISNANKFWARVWESVSDYASLSSSITPQAGTWYHFVFIRRGDSLEMYINGVRDINATLSEVGAGINSDIDSSQFIAIGAEGGTVNYWNGSVDDVRIYNYARTPEQILQDYNGGVGTHF